MLDILNYVCGGLSASERAMRHLAKRVRRQNAMCVALGVVCVSLAQVIGKNVREIDILKNKIKTMEAQQQEGA